MRTPITRPRAPRPSPTLCPLNWIHRASPGGRTTRNSSSSGVPAAKADPPSGLDLLAVVGVDQPRPVRVARDGLRLEAVAPEETGGDGHPVRGRVPVPDPDPRALLREPQPLLALPEGLLGPLLAGDVHVHAEHPEKPSRPVEDAAAENPHPPDGTRSVVVAELQLERFMAGEGRVPFGLHPLEVVGMHRAPPVVDHDRLRPGSVEPDVLAGPGPGRLRQVPLPVPDPGAGLGQPQPLLALPERLFGLLPFGDVLHDRDEVCHPPLRVPDVPDGEMAPDDGPVPADEPLVELVLVDRAGREFGGQPHVLVHVVGMGELGESHPLELLFRSTRASGRAPCSHGAA